MSGKEQIPTTQVQEQQPPAYRMPQPVHIPQPPAPVAQPAPTPAPFAGPPAPVDPAIIGQQYRDQLFAQCAQGNHERTTAYGICGIITAVVCFPCGLICLFADREEKCARCGVSLGRK